MTQRLGGWGLAALALSLVFACASSPSGPAVEPVAIETLFGNFRHIYILQRYCFIMVSNETLV